MERRESRKRKSTSSIIRRKCVYSENDKKRNSIVSVNFNSETLSSSSPIKPDKIEKTKARRKKIRSTQDFNQLNSSLTSQESDISIKSESKKTRKRNKDVYVLPKIDNLIVEPFVLKDNKSCDPFLNCNVYQKRESKAKKSRGPAKIRNFKEYDITTLRNENVIKEKVKKKLNQKKNSSNDSSEEYQTAASIISDSNRDSEVEMKLKKKLGKKHDSSDVVKTKYENYAKRIKKMLLNDCKLSSEESSDNDNSLNSRRSLPKYKFSERLSVTNVQQTDDTEKTRRSPECKEQNNSKYLDTNFSSNVSDELGEQGKYVKSRINVTEKQRKSTKRSYRKSNKGPNMLNLSNYFVEMKDTTKESSTDDPIDIMLRVSDDDDIKFSEDVSYTLSNDGAEESDDVFEMEKEYTANIQKDNTFNADKSDLKNSKKKQYRKSVRFASLTAPEEDIDIRRCTFDVNKCTDSINLFDEKNSIEKTSSIMSKTNNTSGIQTPKILDEEIGSSSINSKINLSMGIEAPQEKSFINDSVDEISKLNETFELTSSKHLPGSPKILDECSSIELLSPIYGKQYPIKCINSFSPNDKVCYIGNSNSTMINSQMDSKRPLSINLNLNIKKNESSRKELSRDSSQIYMCSKSVIDLTTPHFKKLRKSSDVILISSTEKSSEKSMQRCSKKLHRESTFSKDISIDENTSKKTNDTFDNIRVLKDNLDTNDGIISMLSEKDLSNTNGYIKGDSFEILKVSPISIAVKKVCEDSVLVKGSSGKRDHSPQNVSEVDANKKLNTTFNYDKTNSNNSKHNLDSLENDGNGKTPVKPKLNRTATFTKEGQGNIYKKNTSDMQYNSSVVGDSSYNNLVDTSKVTKRRQWDKSQLSMSFLGSPLDIGNISAPWREGTILNNTFEKSEANVAVYLPELEKSTKWYEKTGLPLSGTSTPVMDRKNLLKKALLKEKNVIISDKNLSKSSSKPIVKPTRSKMPNFALIHQRAYNKLESLTEMSERKAQRAKLLLSGCKPDNTTDINTSSKSKKFLHFSPAKSKKIPLSTSTKSNESEKKLVLPVANISITKIKKITPSKSNPKVVAKENKRTPIMKKKELLKVKSRIPTKVPHNIVVEKKGFTKYGFKVGTKEARQPTKEEQLKAVASKTKVIKNTVEQRRNVIQGVRSNRRFELLMGLRNK